MRVRTIYTKWRSKESIPIICLKQINTIFVHGRLDRFQYCSLYCNPLRIVAHCCVRPMLHVQNVFIHQINWRKSFCTSLLAHGGHTRYWNMFWVFLYEITHFTPSAVVNCDTILWVLLSILVFIYRQIIILSKYNVCINLCFVLFLILWKNNWYTLFWSSAFVILGPVNSRCVA